MLKLNLGAGLAVHKKWVCVDKYPTSMDVLEADVLEGLPFPDEHFDFVLMNHVLQVFTYNEHEAVLKEVRRVMKPGATLRILTPDLDRAIGAYHDRDHNYFPISEDLEDDISGKFARYLFWHGETRCAFTVESITDLLLRNDFQNVTYGAFGDCELDSREEESLIVECKK